MNRPTILFLVTIVTSLLVSCSLLEPPPVPAIPATPTESAAMVLEEVEVASKPAVPVTPAADPAITALLNAVSTQQLTAYVQMLESFRTRNTFSATEDPSVGIGAASEWIFEELKRIGGEELEVEYQNFQADIDGLLTNQRNIIATLPGESEHEAVIVIMAHYDSRNVDLLDGSSPAPGADDNGSGVALLIELARLFSARQWNQTIIFAAFAAEEQGTYGSQYFVRNFMLSGEVIDAAFNNDTVGGRVGIPQSIRVFSPGPDTHSSRQLARYVDLIGGLYLPTFRVDLIDSLDREGRYGDHREFVNAGIPAVRLTESEEDPELQHSSDDTSDVIDFEYLQLAAQLNFAVVANLAGAPPRPEAPTVAPMESPGSYLLTWIPDPRAAGYMLSFRPINSSEYAPFRYISPSDAGNVALTDLDPAMTYAVSMAAIDTAGRVSGFSPEVLTESIR